MPRARKKPPGSGYPNRTDRQAPVAAPGQTYGEAGAQIAAQQSVPLPASSFTPPPRPPVTPLGAPTQRPDEPVTAGVPLGAGPGPEVLGLGGSTVLDALRGVYAEFPDDDLRGIIEQLELEGRA